MPERPDPDRCELLAQSLAMSPSLTRAQQIELVDILRWTAMRARSDS